jgi:hypothetical protein
MVTVSTGESADLSYRVIDHTDVRGTNAVSDVWAIGQNVRSASDGPDHHIAMSTEIYLGIGEDKSDTNQADLFCHMERVPKIIHPVEKCL